jgi:hypothetical protein
MTHLSLPGEQTLGAIRYDVVRSELDFMEYVKVMSSHERFTLLREYWNYRPCSTQLSFSRLPGESNRCSVRRSCGHFQSVTVQLTVCVATLRSAMVYERFGFLIYIIMITVQNDYGIILLRSIGCYIQIKSLILLN